MMPDLLVEKARRKEREFQSRRAEILEQAGKIFASKGFHQATVAEIAGASGFAIGTIYHFFHSKESIYAVMIREGLDRMCDGAARAVAREKDFARKLESLIRSHFQFVEENADFCRLLIRGGEISTVDGGLSTVRHMAITGYMRQIELIEEIIKEASGLFPLKNVDTRLMACSLFGMMKAISFEWLIEPGKTDLVRRVPLVLEIFLKGVADAES